MSRLADRQKRQEKKEDNAKADTSLVNVSTGSEVSKVTSVRIYPSELTKIDVKRDKWAETYNDFDRSKYIRACIKLAEDAEPEVMQKAIEAVLMGKI